MLQGRMGLLVDLCAVTTFGQAAALLPYELLYVRPQSLNIILSVCIDHNRSCLLSAQVDRQYSLSA